MEVSCILLLAMEYCQSDFQKTAIFTVSSRYRDPFFSVKRGLLFFALVTAETLDKKLVTNCTALHVIKRMIFSIHQPSLNLKKC